MQRARERRRGRGWQGERRFLPVLCGPLLVAVVGCSEAPAPAAASTSAAPSTSEPTSALRATAPSPTPSPVEPLSRPGILVGEVVELAPDSSGEDGIRTLLIELPSEPRPPGPIVAYAPIHHGTLAMREIATESTPDAPIVVVDTADLGRCDTHARRARRLHAVTTTEEGEDGLETTYLALELEACPSGMLAAVGARSDNVVGMHLTTTEVTDPAPLELVDLVRESDSAYADPPAASDYRVLDLAAMGVTIVIGNQAHVIRDGRELHERWGGSPENVVVVGGTLLFEMASPSEGWTSRLECFHPTYLAAECEIIDSSGTPTNVRAAPSGRSEVRMTLERGARPSADDHVGSWFHVTTTPAGWVHASAIRCPELPRAPRTCD